MKPKRVRHVPCSLEKAIIDKIGDNKTREKTFNDGVFITVDKAKVELLGFYTYRGEVCILDSLGMDVSFSEYEQANKEIIHKNIVSNNYY